VDGMAFGVLLAVIQSQPYKSRWRQWFDWFSVRALVPLALLTLAAHGVTRGEHGPVIPFALLYTLTVMTATCLIGVLLNQRVSILSRFFKLPFLVALSELSFCIYIIHGPMYWSIHRLLVSDIPRFNSVRTMAASAVSFTLTIVIAKLSWRFFESPLLRRSKRLYRYQPSKRSEAAGACDRGSPEIPRVSASA